MRKIDFKDLKLKNIDNEEAFYKYYLKNLQDVDRKSSSFELPNRQYEIFTLNNFDNKVFLLNKNYIVENSNENQELFFDYSIAYKIYNLMVDIQDGIDAEDLEFNELYKEERLQKYKEILNLKKQDDDLFNKALYEYNIIKNSAVYKNYLKLLEENNQLKEQNEILTKQLNEKNVGFFKRFINKFKTKRLPM